ncbi:MAG TPA: hypothetical protein PKC12_06510 [Thiobacillaceae bacterium]|nr:hypothetical protein [Thiobacillaceae bacterium]
MQSRNDDAPPLPNRATARLRWILLTLLLGLGSGPAFGATDDAAFDGAATVNEGSLQFLAAPPAKAAHHHQNRIRISPESLSGRWVTLTQCHDNLDAVPRAQITFRDGYVRALRVDAAHGIGAAWVEGASVQLAQITPGARLCLSAETRALRKAGDGVFALLNGPYMRRFLDGYYPMRVTLDIIYPPELLKVSDISPRAQPGLSVAQEPGAIRLDALFEGELRTRIEFRQVDAAEYGE